MVAGGVDVVVVGGLDEDDAQPTPIVNAAAEKSRIVRFMNWSPEDACEESFGIDGRRGVAPAVELQFHIVDHSAPVSFLISSAECR
jgi:hypothetical protein